MEAFESSPAEARKVSYSSFSGNVAFEAESMCSYKCAITVYSCGSE
jgi:hypothetical protein